MADRGKRPSFEELQRQIDSAWQPMEVHGRPPLDGIEGSVGCMKCGEVFSMTLGSVLPFVSARGTRGFLCQPCLEKVNHARVALRLEPFPVPLAGYRGRALSDIPLSFTSAQWLKAADGRELIRFAAPRIPPQHLGLVLASLAASSWRHFHHFAPDDPRPALGLAALRGWCVGETTVAELGAALEGVKQAARSANARRNPAPHNAVMAIWSALEAPLESHPARLVNEVTGVVEYVVCAEVEDANTQGVITRTTREQKLEATAKLIRRQMPWPAVASSRWEFSAPGLAVAGDAVLRIDGWEIGDAVTIEEFKKLSGPRAVAFDASQVGRHDHLGAEWTEAAPVAAAETIPSPAPPKRRWWEATPEEKARAEEVIAPLRRVVDAVDGFFETWKRLSLIAAAAMILFALTVDSCRGNRSPSARPTRSAPGK